MVKPTSMARAFAVALTLAPLPSFAASDADLAQIRQEIQAMKKNYEARIQALEQQLHTAQQQTAPSVTSNVPGQTAQADAGAPSIAAQAGVASTDATADAASASAAVAAAPIAGNAPAAGANVYNPAVALILGGTYARLSQDPSQYRLQGFMPGGEDIGPGARSFRLGESELTLSANVDPQFSGQLTFSLANDNSVSTEEAFFQTSALANGITVKGGRMLSGIGYLNSIHAHAWDFVDAPLAYQAFFGGQYKTDGLQMKWLAPTDRFLEFGLEAGNGHAFPGNDTHSNALGSTALYAHIGDDIGDSASWRAGASWLHSRAVNRTYGDLDAAGAAVTNAYSGNSNTLILDGVYKWAPHGNATQTNFKLQGEYFRRRDNGALAFDTTGRDLAGAYSAAQSGWYLQGVYQFMPLWRFGLRYDRLSAGSPSIGLVSNGTLGAADFSRLASYDPRRVSVMLDYSPSEFSRLRLQVAQDRSRPGVTDNQVFLQYIMSLGAHGAHTF